MPRRPPPTALRLVEGPLPPRGRAKFTLPSVPRPIFHPPAVVAHGPVPRARLQAKEGAADGGKQGAHGKGQTRGPWDHSRSISVPLDVSALLQTPARAAVNVESVRGG
ncbi:hypothetical protein FA95DRAFT_1491300 [Auriscalpium vulgare]|uniref:Uncharacterized protein n=1 Tax=Auriscalpium vulgare TaxID=40419 RepID=A0ACB8RWF6_9AGAM|nr:hypothetical protein FA95DRAFT_1491300 [Auriscalpium vulgare]